ncbi:unnamed protein product [Closterium sp. NIES-64]|nr:unnamed protein product [Closterium sp. NIES-64]
MAALTVASSLPARLAPRAVARTSALASSRADTGACCPPIRASSLRVARTPQTITRQTRTPRLVVAAAGDRRSQFSLSLLSHRSRFFLSSCVAISRSPRNPPSLLSARATNARTLPPPPLVAPSPASPLCARALCLGGQATVDWAAVRTTDHLTVGDCMSAGKLVCAQPSTTVDQALELLVEHRITGMPVVDADGRLVSGAAGGEGERGERGGVGVVSDYDLLALDSISAPAIPATTLLVVPPIPMAPAISLCPPAPMHLAWHAGVGSSGPSSSLFPEAGSTWKVHLPHPFTPPTPFPSPGPFSRPLTHVFLPTTPFLLLLCLLHSPCTLHCALPSSHTPPTRTIKSPLPSLSPTSHVHLPSPPPHGHGRAHVARQAFREIQKLLIKTRGRVVADVMTPHPHTVHPSTNLDQAARSHTRPPTAPPHYPPPCIFVRLHPCLPATMPLCPHASLQPCLSAPMPPCNHASLPPCLPATMPLCPHASLQPCLSAPMPPCNHASLPPCLPATMPLCPHASLQPCLSAPMPPCDHASLPPCLPATMPPCTHACFLKVNFRFPLPHPINPNRRFIQCSPSLPPALSLACLPFSLSAPSPTLSLAAGRMLLENQHRRLPVVDDNGKLVGLITRGNVVKAALALKRAAERDQAKSAAQ